jgi:hypothetical protein
MSNVTRVSVNIESVEILISLCNAMPNLEELNLSLIDFHDPKDLSFLEVPQTLQKLHLELGCYHCCTDFETVKTFLQVFRNQLRSLVFISVNADKSFSIFDKFQNLVKDFSRLDTFEYYIRTAHQPAPISLFPNVEHLPDLNYSFSTLPRLRQFDITTEHTRGGRYFSSDLTLSGLFNCYSLWIWSKKIPTTFELKSDLRLLNLQNIEFISLTKDMVPAISRYISNVMSLSPNLTHLQIHFESDTIELNKQLSQMIPVKQKKQITHFELGISWNNDGYYHSTFLSELSEIFPNLQTFRIRIKLKRDDKHFPLNEFVQSLRSYFRKLSRLLELHGRIGSTDKKFDILYN